MIHNIHLQNAPNAETKKPVKELTPDENKVVGALKLLRGVVEDFTLRQRLLELLNLSLGEVGGVMEPQLR